MPPERRDPWPEFLRTFAWIGLNTFGGPVAQIGFMHDLAVEKRRWLTDSEFVHLLNFANVLPGPEALELAIHLGYLRRGPFGGIVAGLFFIAPGFVALTALAWLYSEHGNLRVVRGALDGIRPVAVALIAAAVMRLASRALAGIATFVLTAAAFVASFVLGVPFLLLLLACGLVGLRLPEGRAPLPETFRPRLLIGMLAAAIASGFLFSPRETPQDRHPAASSTASAGRLGEIAWVNTKAALVTFGGAYTVLPYLREQMVGVHGWVDDEQMVDALAMGETTPGPLVSVAIFLSYLAAGLRGAVVSGVFLFLPSFVLVLGLGRYIESVERLPYARSFLHGVSAGTIGLILAMSANVVPQSIRDLPSAALATAAFFVLWRIRISALVVVGAGAAVGIARGWLY